MRKRIKCHAKKKRVLESSLTWSDVFGKRRYVTGNEFWAYVSDRLGIPFTPSYMGNICGYDLNKPPFVNKEEG